MNTADFIQKIREFASANGFLDCNRVLVALSGGADSVALLHTLRSLGIDCVAAHCNFHLRGEESMRDERFVTDLCRSLNVPLIKIDFDVDAYINDHHVSTEMACRELRYTWFRVECRRQGCQYIAVGHHLDDNIETVFLNMMRGTGITGLSGIKARNGNIIRPLLCVKRAEILQFLNEIGQSYVTDSTNLENDFARNKIRNVILPCFEQNFPNAINGISTTIANLQGVLAVYKEAVDAFLSQAIVPTFWGERLSLMYLLGSADPTTLLHEWAALLGFNSAQQADMLNCALNNAVSAQFIAGKYIAEIGREYIDLIDTEKIDNKEYTFQLTDDLTSLPIPLSVTSHNTTEALTFKRDGNIAYFDFSLIHQPLTLRHYRQGDRFKPFGMKGTKLVSDFFNEKKLSLAEKLTTWLLCDSDNILWIVGLRAGDCFKVTPQSSKILILETNPQN